MCGIVGIWNLDGEPVDEKMLDRFTDSLAHRGPDGRGTFINKTKNVGLGHRRLAILDRTDSGRQPMKYSDGRYWIVFNGEIYNFLELRSLLIKSGYDFRSDSDTEVVLAAYLHWGQDSQFKLNGMWSFAIWDTSERVLFLSRDRFGVKPLFYMYDGKHFLFASELKAFMSLPLFLRKGFDNEMIARMKNEESSKRTILSGVSNLQGGHCLSLRQGYSPQIRKWWETSDHLHSVPSKFSNQVDQFKEIFSNACTIRMRSDVPIATALSGGLDSSSVMCSMVDARSRLIDDRRLAEDWEKAFVLVYKGTSHDERRYADKVIRHTGVTPVYKEINPFDICPDDLVSSIRSLEAIQGTEPALGPWLLYREMKKNNVSVSIDGHGGDEILSGYHHHLEAAMKDTMWPWPQFSRRTHLASILSGLYTDGVSEGSQSAIPTAWDTVKSILPNRNRWRSKVLNYLHQHPEVLHAVRNCYRKIKDTAGTLGSNSNPRWLLIDPAHIGETNDRNRSGGREHFDNLSSCLYADFHNDVLPRILRNFDRVSMAHGVEIRAPFLDWRLVCYAFSLPTESKLSGGYTKRILREAMKGTLPEDIRTRTGKMGFASPMPIWFRTGLKSHVLDSVNSREFIESAIWNGSVIRDFVEDCYQKEDYNNGVKAWKYIQAMHLMNSFSDMEQSS